MSDMKFSSYRSVFFYFLWVIVLTVSFGNSYVFANAVVDNRDAATSQTGTWEVSGGTNPFDPADPNANSVWARGGDDTFSWHFTPSQTGAYEVWEWHSGWSSRTSAAPHQITHAGGTANIPPVNQKINAGKWNSLGVYQFTAGQSYRVTVTSVVGDTISTCADAVRWTLVTSGNNPPTATIGSISPSPANQGQTVSFAGTGTDTDGTIIGYQWNSNINGVLSTSRSFSASTLSVGIHTITFKVQDNDGNWSAAAARALTVNMLNTSEEHMFYCMGYGSGADPIKQAETWLKGLGATKDGTVWTYTNTSGKKHVIYFVQSIEGMRQALMTEGAHVLYRGHANYGLGSVFPTATERVTNIIENIYYIDDPRIFKISSPILSVSVSSLRGSHAFPNWWPIFRDKTSGIMPYDFGKVVGNAPFTYDAPAHNYYITYQMPGNTSGMHYQLDLVRFPDSGYPAWYASDGSWPNPSNSGHLQYFIRKPGTVIDPYNPKAHYGSKTILFRKAPDITKDQLKYKRLYYEACNSGNYFLDTFSRGIVFYTVGNSVGEGFYYYLKNYLEGKSDLQIWQAMQARQAVYDYYDFNKLPSQQ